jgi:hypothetical protein
MILMKCAEEARHSSLSRRAAAGLYGISTLGLYQEQFSSSAILRRRVGGEHEGCNDAHGEIVHGTDRGGVADQLIF